MGEMPSLPIEDAGKPVLARAWLQGLRERGPLF